MEEWNHNRFSDDEIYLNEDRFDDPKEAHIRIANIIKDLSELKGSESVVDCGCATGELLNTIKNRVAGIQINGFDVSKRMVEKGNKRLNTNRLFVQDLNIEFKEWDNKEKHEYVTCSGVLCIFDDYKKILDNLLSLTKRGGYIIIHGSFNPYGIDVIMRYRRDIEQSWEGGWNIFSKLTIEKCLQKHERVKSFAWNDYELDINIDERAEDPMRTWTANLNGEKILVNGAGQIMRLSNLVIETY